MKRNSNKHTQAMKRALTKLADVWDMCAQDGPKSLKKFQEEDPIAYELAIIVGSLISTAEEDAIKLIQEKLTQPTSTDTH